MPTFWQQARAFSMMPKGCISGDPGIVLLQPAASDVTMRWWSEMDRIGNRSSDERGAR